MASLIRDGQIWNYKIPKFWKIELERFFGFGPGATHLFHSDTKKSTLIIYNPVFKSHQDHLSINLNGFTGPKNRRTIRFSTKWLGSNFILKNPSLTWLQFFNFWLIFYCESADLVEIPKSKLKFCEILYENFHLKNRHRCGYLWFIFWSHFGIFYNCVASKGLWTNENINQD